MSIYSLPEIKVPKFKGKKTNNTFLVIILSLLFGVIGGVVGVGYVYPMIEDYSGILGFSFPEKVIEKETLIEKDYIPQTSHEERIIESTKEASPSVVSIIVTKDLPVRRYGYFPFEEFFDYEQDYQNETEKQQIGGGTGFIISEDGMILTNRHVVSDEDAEYTVVDSQGDQFYAEVLARDPVKDLAVIKIDSNKELKPLKFGDSDNLKLGQTVVAIGNALGEFQNTVSVGVVSGLKRNVLASGSGQTEQLENLIQTDAAINSGNSGGPLLNLRGEVIGINVAMSQTAENIGFAIPINEAKRSIEQVKETGEITYPFIGIYYTLITPELAQTFGLSVEYGAWIGRDGEGNMTEEAIFPGSAAEEAGLRRDDIITKINGEKITQDNSLAEMILKYDPGDTIGLEVIRGGNKMNVTVVLGKR
jgi:serine protease Do